MQRSVGGASRDSTGFVAMEEEKKLNAASKEQGALTKMCSLCIVTQCDSRAKWD